MEGSSKIAYFGGGVFNTLRDASHVVRDLDIAGHEKHMMQDDGARELGRGAAEWPDKFQMHVQMAHKHKRQMRPQKPKERKIGLYLLKEVNKSR